MNDPVNDPADVICPLCGDPMSELITVLDAWKCGTCDHTDLYSVGVDILDPS